MRDDMEGRVGIRVRAGWRVKERGVECVLGGEEGGGEHLKCGGWHVVIHARASTGGTCGISADAVAER